MESRLCRSPFQFLLLQVIASVDEAYQTARIGILDPILLIIFVVINFILVFH